MNAHEQNPTENPDDLCVCGDWRIHHRNGTGPCTFNSREFDLCHGGQDCMEFRPISFDAARAALGEKP